GYSLYWHEGDPDFKRFDWKFGSVFTPTDMLFHQHFNTSGEPARYLAIAFGGMRYPTVADKRKTFEGMDKSVKAGGRQIEYEDEDPRIRRLFEDELRRASAPPSRHLRQPGRAPRSALSQHLSRRTSHQRSQTSSSPSRAVSATSPQPRRPSSSRRSSAFR